MDKFPAIYRGQTIESFQHVEGPIYADRRFGRLTFADFDSWYEEDKQFVLGRLKNGAKSN